MTKNFIDLSDFSKTELRYILDLAHKIKSKPMDFKKTLNNKSLGMLLEQKSLRTRVSFDVGMKKMGGNVIELNPDSIGFGGRESDLDIIRTLSQYIDCIMIRCWDHEKIKLLASYNYLPIINGLSNFSHPCQILSDIFTIEEVKGTISKILIFWCGDINNVSTSLLQASNIFGFRLNLAAPKKILLENRYLLDRYQSENIQIFEDPYEAIDQADCVMTDVWLSMGESQNYDKISLMNNYQVNEKLMKNASNNSIFMHCLPAHRNKEVTDAVIDGKNSIVWQQAQNKMYILQSIINYCIT